MIAQMQAAEGAATTLYQQGGVMGALMLLLLFHTVYLERRRDARETERETARGRDIDKLVAGLTARDELRERKTDRLVETVADLIQSNLIETLSRPGLNERATHDAQTLQSKYRERPNRG